jgi:polysaccharide pyruvyl transferase WcaK-like protein
MGDTPVMDQWGLEWPLRANAGKLKLCHALGKPVHAVGVGIDRLSDPEGLHIFQECYAPIASWTVRSARCRQALLEMGIPEERIVVGADWAWLLPVTPDIGWAEEWLSKRGAENGRVNIGVNLVNEIWRDDRQMKETWAALLDRIVEKLGAQLFFFCSESRPGAFFDRAAAEDVRSIMKHPSILVADRYYQASEMISLISLMQVTISQRYHFTLFSVLADVCPISIQRGQKMLALNEELGLPFVGDMERIDEAGIVLEVSKALENPEPKLALLRQRRVMLESRARNNLFFLRSRPF